MSSLLYPQLIVDALSSATIRDQMGHPITGEIEQRRKSMKRRTILGTTVLLALACCAQAQTEEGAKCTTETLKGAYGVLLTGTNLAAVVAPGRAGFVGQLQQAIGTDIIVFDGKGNFTQVDNVKGTVSGLSPDRPGSGTY